MTVHGRRKGKILKIVQPSSPPPPAPPVGTQASITIGDEVVETADDLEFVRLLGRGAYGVVDLMRHRRTGTSLAVKRIPSSVNTTEHRRLITDLDVNLKSSDCDYTVHCYGAMFLEGNLWICMEVMEASLDQLYPQVFTRGRSMPEPVLGKIAFSVLSALHYLQTQLSVIHRDVKPSNILLSNTGKVKMCDFGISGYLVNSIAKTKDAGSRPYMAPERIDPTTDADHYYVSSDVWSFGISMIEVATGRFPYTNWNSVFDQLKQVVFDPAPSLPPGDFSPEFSEFISLCVQKLPEERENYSQLLQHDFILSHARLEDEMMGSFIQEITPAIAQRGLRDNSSS